MTAPGAAPQRRIVVVVPCYNEAARLDVDAFFRFVDDDTGLDVGFLFVDDGSTDATADVLAGLAARAPAHIRVLTLHRNAGKAEAVRAGLACAVDAGAAVVGYLDADLSTSVVEMARLLAVLDARADVDVVLGSRVALLGRTIERSPVRHVLGRVFATGASLALDLAVYDTQCGAKCFRASVVDAAVRAPFSSRWAFDVELLARLLEAGVPAARFVEVPVAWRDVKGSKLHAAAMARAGLDLARIALTRSRSRA
jgi:dolichyl-phosphate beta-glucosyltransferase